MLRVYNNVVHMNFNSYYVDAKTVTITVIARNTALQSSVRAAITAIKGCKTETVEFCCTYKDLKLHNIADSAITNKVAKPTKSTKLENMFIIATVSLCTLDIIKNTKWNNKQKDARNGQVSQKSFILSMQPYFTSIDTDIIPRMALLFTHNKVLLAC